MSSRSLQAPQTARTIYIRAKKEEKPSSAKRWGLLIVVVSTAIWLTGLFTDFTTTLTLLTVMGLGLAAIGLRFKTAGLLGIGMLTTLDALTRYFLLTGGLWRWNTFNYFLLLVMGLNALFLLRLNDVNSRILEIFLLLLGMELVLSLDVETGILDILNIVTMFGFVVYFARAAKDEDSIYWLGVVTGTLSAVGSFVFYTQMNNLPYINPNAWSFFPLSGMFGTAMGLPYAREKGNKYIIPLLLLSAVNLVWVFLSGSRGSLLMGLCVVIYLIISLRSISWTTLAIVLGVILWSILAAQFVDQQAYAMTRLQKTFDTTNSIDSRTSHRSDIAMAGLEVFFEHPLGTGTGSFEIAVQQTSILFQHARPAHSAWVKVLAENGVPGFLLLFAYVISFLFVGWSKRNINIQYLFLGFLVTSVFATAFLSKEFEGKSLWMLAAGVTVMMRPEQFRDILKKEVPEGLKVKRQELRRIRYGRKQ